MLLGVVVRGGSMETSDAHVTPISVDSTSCAVVHQVIVDGDGGCRPFTGGGDDLGSRSTALPAAQIPGMLVRPLGSTATQRKPSPEPLLSLTWPPSALAELRRSGADVHACLAPGGHDSFTWLKER